MTVFRIVSGGAIRVKQKIQTHLKGPYLHVFAFNHVLNPLDRTKTWLAVCIFQTWRNLVRFSRDLFQRFLLSCPTRSTQLNRQQCPRCLKEWSSQGSIVLFVHSNSTAFDTSKNSVSYDIALVYDGDVTNILVIIFWLILEWTLLLGETKSGETYAELRNAVRDVFLIFRAAYSPETEGSSDWMTLLWKCPPSGQGRSGVHVMPEQQSIIGVHAAFVVPHAEGREVHRRFEYHHYPLLYNHPPLQRLWRCYPLNRNCWERNTI